MNLLRAVELLGQHASDQKVGPSRLTERHNQGGFVPNLVRQTVRAADDKNELVRSGIAPMRQAFCKFAACKIPSGFV